MKPLHMIAGEAATSLITLAHHPHCPRWISAHLSATASELRSAAHHDRAPTAATDPPDDNESEGFGVAYIGEVS